MPLEPSAVEEENKRAGALGVGAPTDSYSGGEVIVKQQGVEEERKDSVGLSENSLACVGGDRAAGARGLAPTDAGAAAAAAAAAAASGSGRGATESNAAQTRIGSCRGDASNVYAIAAGTNVTTALGVLGVVRAVESGGATHLPAAPTDGRHMCGVLRGGDSEGGQACGGKERWEAVAAEIGAPEIGAPEIGAPEIGAPEIGAPEIGAPVSVRGELIDWAETQDAGEVAPEVVAPEAVRAETEAVEVGAGEAGAAESKAAESNAGETGAVETGEAGAGAAKTDAGEAEAGEAEAGEAEAGEAEAGEAEAGETEAGEEEAGETEAGEVEAGEAEAGEAEAGEAEAGEAAAGEAAAGEAEAGEAAAGEAAAGEAGAGEAGAAGGKAVETRAEGTRAAETVVEERGTPTQASRAPPKLAKELNSLLDVACKTAEQAVAAWEVGREIHEAKGAAQGGERAAQGRGTPTQTSRALPKLAKELNSLLDDACKTAEQAVAVSSRHAQSALMGSWQAMGGREEGGDGGCPKAYHRECTGLPERVFESSAPWTCSE
ncbi:hypothetical protein CLOP_g9782 [Closterium sp. NIES-67]|nr:hypothetical protein CLOP_g9782 [Closterium sp. NIES-67]